METKKIEIEIPAGKRAEWVNGVLTLIDETPKDNRPITERVNTFEDAVKELGESHPLIAAYNGYKSAIDPVVSEDADVVAYLKLRIIAAALNEGWKPQFTDDEYRYYPWFVLYTEEEYKELDEEEKSRVVYRSFHHAHAYGGVACSYAYSDSSYTVTYIGSRLAFKNSDLARYAGKQFLDIWADYVFKPKCVESDNE